MFMLNVLLYLLFTPLYPAGDLGDFWVFFVSTIQFLRSFLPFIFYFYPFFSEGDENFTLKEHLIDELYYNLVPEEAWNKLLAWYGIVENQPPIPRKVVEYGMYVKHCKVEVYLIEFKLCRNSAMEKVVTHQFSKADTLGIMTSNV